MAFRQTIKNKKYQKQKKSRTKNLRNKSNRFRNKMRGGEVYTRVKQFSIDDNITEYFMADMGDMGVKYKPIGHFVREHNDKDSDVHQYYFSNANTALVFEANNNQDKNGIFIEKYPLYVKNDDGKKTLEEAYDDAEKALIEDEKQNPNFPVFDETENSDGYEEVGRVELLPTGELNAIHQTRYPENWQIYKKISTLSSNDKIEITVQFKKKKV
jgi:hypothetical protein